MPVSIFSFPSIEHTNFSAYGELTLDDIYAALTSFYNNYSTPTMNTLWDLRTTTVKNISNEEIDPIRQYRKRQAKVRQGGKTAIIASNDLDKIISEPIERYEKNHAIAVEIFRSKEEAVQWLAED